MENLINAFSGTYTGNITLNATGDSNINYGPESGKRIIAGDVTITGNTAQKITLQNLVINGKLTVNTPNADVEVASSSEVKGTTNIQDVKSSTFINNGQLSSVVITDSNGTSFKNNGNVETVTFNGNLNNGLAPNITISGSKPIGTLVINRSANINIASTSSEIFTNPVKVKATSTIVSEKTFPVIIDDNVKVTVKANNEDKGEVAIGTGTETNLDLKDMT